MFHCGRALDSALAKCAANTAGITHDGKPVSELTLEPDVTDSSMPTLLQSGSLTFFAIERAGKLGMRVRDSNSPHRFGFKGLEYFPVDST